MSARPRMYSAHSDAINRPERWPTDHEARHALALDLTRNVYGARPARAAFVMWLPLMEVALSGAEGMDIAAARDWSRAA